MVEAKISAIKAMDYAYIHSEREVHYDYWM